MEYNKINIFFDTNKLENRVCSKNLLLSKIAFSADFHSVVNLSKSNDNIKLYIPDIVWDEVKHHLRSCFSSSKQSMLEAIANYKKIFGDIIEIQYELKFDNYEEHLRVIEKEFFDEYGKYVSLAEHDRTENGYKNIVDKAIKQHKPFTKARAGGKDFSDAGFKDALIVESILNTCKDDELGILITNDKDFEACFNDYGEAKYKIFNDVPSLNIFLDTVFGDITEQQIKDNFLNDGYLHQTLFNRIGLVFDESVGAYTIENISIEDDIATVNITVIINEVKYTIIVLYDSIANEIQDVTYTKENE